MSGHGKTLEMQAIKVPKPVHLCICRKPWAAHLRKDGKRLARYNNPKHFLAGATLTQIALEEAMR